MMLTPEDSKRVSDAIIEKINNLDIGDVIQTAIEEAVFTSVSRFTRPYINGWKEDWFPLAVEDMLNKIASNVCSVAKDSIDDWK